jgi:glycogen debranching enzyme
MKKVISRIPVVSSIKPLMPPAWAMRSLVSKSGKGIYASSDTLFKGAVFGRDSIEVAEDLMAIKPRLVRRIILTLASLQGETSKEANEEEPGKIVHEYRTPIVDGKPLSDTSRHIYEELSSRWGGDKTGLAYYGSIDATPHYLRMLGKYCQLYGADILERTVTSRSGRELTVKQVAENCADWLQKRLDESRTGLLEYQRRNPRGIENQVWKDSIEFYVHEDGQLANHATPIASIEVQGLAYDALLAASILLPDQADSLQTTAGKLRIKTLESLWLTDREYFALGLDFDKDGHTRLIKTTTANPASLLDTAIFDGLPERRRYVTAIVKKIMSRDFLTDAGIRSRALSAADLIPFWDYHGSYTTWPKETYDIAKGLNRQGFPELAKELENRLLNVVLRNGQYPEFVYVDDWGRVLASAPSAQSHGDFVLVDSTNTPERIQAWTVSAIVAIANHRFAAKVIGKRKLQQEAWQRELEQAVLTHMPRMRKLLNPMTLSARYPAYKYKLVRDQRHSVDAAD